jgi:hypothetical protein
MPESPQAMRAILRPFMMRACAAIVLCWSAASCTRAMFVAPAGPGDAAPDAAAAWTEATAGCRDARSFVAAVRASGKVGQERVWPVSLELAVTADQSIYISATAVGNSVFVLAGTANRATLWLRHDNRAVTAAPADIMEALVGVPLSPARLMAVLTGCVARSLDVVSAARYPNLLAIHTADARVFLAQTGGTWRTTAAEADRFTVEFARKSSAQPDDIWLWAQPAPGQTASLHLTVTDGQINGPVPPNVFQAPAGAQAAAPMTLDELRAAGPWKK